MTDANPLPDSAEVTLQNWVDDPEVTAFLQARNWKGAFARYQYLEIAEPPPFTSLTKSLRDATLAIITSGGLYVAEEQPAFDAANVYGDPSIRLFPIDTPHDRLLIAHDHYDHTVPLQDLRTINPAAHVMALRDEGFIGGLFPQQISFSGYIPDWQRVMNRLVPTVLDQLRGQPIDAALLVPV